MKERESHVRGVCKKGKKGTVMSEACARNEKEGQPCQRRVQEMKEMDSQVRGVCKK